MADKQKRGPGCLRQMLGWAVALLAVLSLVGTLQRGAGLMSVLATTTCVLLSWLLLHRRTTGKQSLPPPATQWPDEPPIPVVSISPQTPATCPTCGATDLPYEDGCCQFCGKPMNY